MDEKSLLAVIYDLAPSRNPPRALEIGDAEWAEMADRTPTPEDAESCRLLSLSASELADYAAADIWRDRARERGIAVGWPELVATLDMAGAFKELSLRNDDYARGRTLDVLVGSSESVEIIRRLRPVAEGPDSGIRVTDRSPSTALLRRFVLEKSGSLLLPLRRWDDAIESFRAAEAAADDVRGRLKARAGLALAHYLRAVDEGVDADVAQALAATVAIEEEAVVAGEADIVDTARHNADVMRRRGADLLLYEIL